jgi:primosomal protein N' (replication factor Y)
MTMSDLSKPMVATVALLSSGIGKPLTYLIPEDMREQARAGMAVAVPLQKRLVTGIILRVASLHSAASEFKPIKALLDPAPVMTDAQLQLARWIADEYYAPIGRACALMVPPGFTAQSAYVFSLPETSTPPKRPPAPDTPAGKLMALLQKRGPLIESKIAAAMKGVPGWRVTLRRLVKEGAVLRDSTLRMPASQPRRNTLVHLAMGEPTLSVVLENIENSRKLQPQVRARRAGVLRHLAAHSGMMWADWLMAETNANRADLAWLAENDYILLGDATRWRDPLADVDYVVKTAPPLTEDQERAWNTIKLRILSSELRITEANSTFNIQHSQFLLRGVTGSGKTEIYMRAVDATLQAGKSAIVLVPEISLTPQTARRFIERFPGKVALIHSKLKPGERFDTWRRIRSGELQVIVGARSALFAPAQHVGLIVLDEEHDPSYKQGSQPYYDTRKAALRYGQLAGATVIFGSATPSLEAWHAVSDAHIPPPTPSQKGGESGSPLPLGGVGGGEMGERLTLLELPNRVRGHVQRIEQQSIRLGVHPAATPETKSVAYQPLPAVQVIDMRAELRGGNSSMLSGALHNALEETLRRGEQALLFLNRRGAASSVICRDCGCVLRCPVDDVPLTLHLNDDDKMALPLLKPAHKLVCHQCDHTEDEPAKCPVCHSARIRHIGLGTQRIEQFIHEQFPKARVVRWDRDTASKTSADVMLGRFVNQQADVLIGTQMIAKGLDLPMVTLVGVVLADVGLFLPDFRSSERVFNLLEQVAGRAGRGLLPGRVIVQTYNPTQPAIAFAGKHDVQGFVQYELAQRKLLRLPPFTRLVRFECSDADEAVARKRCEELVRQLRQQLVSEDAVIGPAPAYYSKRNRQHRWQVIARTHSPADVLAALDLPREVIVDVDPVSVL